MPKHPDEVKNNADLPEDVGQDEHEKLLLENANLRETIQLFSERLSRVESVASKAKLRKYDELNDPEALKPTGTVLSQDGKDPILFLRKVGNVIEGDGGIIEDRQTLHGETLSGVKVNFTFKSLVSLCSGNSIPCQVNNWAEYRERERILEEKRHLFQRSNGKSARVDTVALRDEIKKLEEDLRMSVTLSLDLGKSFTGSVCEIHPTSVLNALP